MSGNDDYVEGENSIENFAFLIDNHEEEKIKKIIDRNDVFKGFPPLFIAGMHTNGTWVLTKFGTKANLSKGCDSKLTDLAEHLGLDVDADILNDIGFTPLMLAVMFGPPKSVEIILSKVGKEGMNEETKGHYTAKVFANCRDDDSIRKLFQAGGKRAQCAPCQACSVM
mmetsp:Transcript_8626/g.11876  ORF Transcript_8626/g.11876 Transcript_8626/m.11876 type:complete len:168 (+) Transcript_8626:102-605(+)|eukprot:CAMPEP_0185263288 /NCGR_PEP_ID=MMETSP1359-20130426/13508_1 /TAXON_ID=552665 /ORGANISM="Bigelowiella longifila, Strain CCMP242" /LENGTH=167 /DNA_ID=CAMNT_0027850675 /DNA_START=65 /DNA_END=568 /DNA_ORIENTATION=+